MDLGITKASIDLIATAVTPVVMISATAILISGISSKHTALSDRLRSLASEHRLEHTAPERRRNIEMQLRLFARRIRLISLAHIGLYLATCLFIGMVLAISTGPVWSAWQRGLLSFFMAGTLVLLGSVILEITELHLAARTMELELEDVVSHANDKLPSRRRY